MYVAVDDTDSTEGSCTTFLATEFIRELSDLDLIGNPRLVRLNPAVPWKTRGNGSLIMRFGKGLGEKRKIGNIGGRDIFCYDRASGWEPDMDGTLKRLIPLVDANHEDSADPGVVVSLKKPSQSFYWGGVRTIMDRGDVENELRRIGAMKYELGCGRGIIGCTCGMAWRPSDSTYELLTYRPRARWGTDRIFEPDTIREAEHEITSSFNSWEDRAGKVAMVPATHCPIMYGFRADDPDDLIRGLMMIKTEPIDRWMIFLTNQGTDDHIIRDPPVLVPNQSYHIEGIVAKAADHIRGGHLFFDIDTKYGRLSCGVYEPSKEFRYVFDNLVVGDRIGVMGELREEPRTLNVEKMQAISLAKDVRKSSNPVCPLCGRTMESVGKGQGFRCRKCRTKASEPICYENVRSIVPGWYEPPTSSRRHLSKPLKRMGLEQPVEFVNRRN